MRGVLVIAVLLAVLSFSKATFPLGTAIDSFLDTLLNKQGRSCDSCPPKAKCRFHKAVILGRCCGCGENIYHRITYCGPDRRCPANMEEICQEYDFLMKCCC